ncbi:MAG TPA: protein kinase [Vicinamibacterales bacterium]|nr:protein kinase [Vicinamibacterales bacterium]
MPLTTGTRLGSYEILGPLGAGGMGEVYRARDTKLNRDVAIKVLPGQLAQDPAALARFEREAQAVAALSHPNILAIYDFGTERGIAYAVSELLEGDTLRVRLADGALTVRKATDFGTHIARGIAAAHERGIVHRDLKPENIFITKDGVVKILDFGLAKAGLAEAARGSSAAEAGETRIAADTTPGTVLGTVGYMSPEQVRGLALDHRTDIFSFGAVLYEMLTGRRAFRGDSHVETMNAILKEDPPEFAEINASLPGSLDRIVRRCLEKQPADRFHSAHDLALALEAMSGASSQSAASIAGAAALAGAPKRRMSSVVAAVAALVIGAGAFFAGRGVGGGETPTKTEFQRLTYRRGPIWSAAIAPDGGTFLYSAAWEGTPRQVYSTRSESPESLALPYVNADVTSISSKGELAIVSNRSFLRGYAQPGTLARAPLSGGALRDVMENVQDATWLPNGTDLAVSHVVDGKYRLEFPIGKVIYETTGWISHLRVSPDGKRVAFLDQPIVGDDRGGPAIVDESGKKQSIPVECESTQGIAWAPSGQEVWFTCASKGLWRALLAATLDGRVRTVLQVPGSLFLGDIASDGTVLLSHDSARRGMVAMAPGETKERDLSWLDWTQPTMLSEDGRTVLFAEEGEGGGAGYGVFLRKTDGSPAVRLGTGEATALSPDGRLVIAQKLDPSPVQFVLMPSGAGQARALTADDITHVFGQFLPDGKRFVFTGFKPDRPPRVWVQAIEGGAPTPVTPEGISGSLVTPDGTKVMGRDLDGQRKLFPFDPKSGPPEPMRFLEPADGVIRFTADGRGVLVRRPAGNGAVQVSRVDLATGTRTPVRTISPLPESISQGGVGQLHMTADGSAYVYGYGVTHSDLFLVKGLK